MKSWACFDADAQRSRRRRWFLGFQFVVKWHCCQHIHSLGLFAGFAHSRTLIHTHALLYTRTRARCSRSEALWLIRDLGKRVWSKVTCARVGSPVQRKLMRSELGWVSTAINKCGFLDKWRTIRRNGASEGRARCALLARQGFMVGQRATRLIASTNFPPRFLPSSRFVPQASTFIWSSFWATRPPEVRTRTIPLHELSPLLRTRFSDC